jgi:rare lipoprotein A
MWWRGVVGALASASGLLVVLSGCAVVRPARPPAESGRVQVGVASWYGPGFHRQPTSSGEIYDQHSLTAAHPTLPLGTRAAVTNLANGRSVEVRINDRGPFHGDRVIDLSYAAAREIDLIGPGTGMVRLEVLGPPGTPTSARYCVQVGSFAEQRRALQARTALAEAFPDTYVARLRDEDGHYYRVRLGPYELRGVAEARAAQVSQLGWPAVVVEEVYR